MQFDRSTRRKFISRFGAAAMVWPHAARAQSSERMRRIGALLRSSADDPLSQAVIGAFSQGLQQFGWTIGRNVRIEYRWGAVDDDRIRRHATELVALAPDVILAFGSTATRAIQSETRDLPIIL